LTKSEHELSRGVEVRRSRLVARQGPTLGDQPPGQRISALHDREGERLDGIGRLPDRQPRTCEAADGHLSARRTRPDDYAGRAAGWRQAAGAQDGEQRGGGGAGLKAA
jgi:hypothetical protein